MHLYWSRSCSSHTMALCWLRMLLRMTARSSSVLLHAFGSTVLNITGRVSSCSSSIWQASIRSSSLWPDNSFLKHTHTGFTGFEDCVTSRAQCWADFVTTVSRDRRIRIHTWTCVPSCLWVWCRWWWDRCSASGDSPYDSSLAEADSVCPGQLWLSVCVCVFVLKFTWLITSWILCSLIPIGWSEESKSNTLLAWCTQASSGSAHNNNNGQKHKMYNKFLTW